MFTQNLKSLKTIREIIKYAIILGSLLMTIHCCFLILGSNLAVINFLFGMSVMGFIVLFLSTYLLGFCNNIRYLLTHIFITRCCCAYQMYYGFGIYLTPMRWMMFISGIFLLIKTIRDTYVKGAST